jgi:hypothetical protein
MDSVFAGPAGPWLPVSPLLPVAPVLPTGSTRLSVWLGLIPVIVAAAVPLVTVPMESVFAGPDKPCVPWGPVAPAGETVTSIVSPVVAVIVGDVLPEIETVTLMGSPP